MTGILAFYKYIGLFATWINNLTDKNLISLNTLAVPIGLSFAIFESISYVVDIYREDADAGCFLDCAIFLSLFPKLVSGPIVLWRDFKPQLGNRRASIDKISAGIDRIIIGYAKKAIIADTFGVQIALINSGIAGTGVDTATMWLRALLYFFQLYFDFSGYSDIAIGLSRIFGFDFKENFNYPYISKSITDFWRRWHISLGSWFREYVYIPLGGNRRGNVYLHLLIVFLLTGIWHGAGNNFLIWGCIHGICVMVERKIRDQFWYKKVPSTVKWVFTIVIVFFSWILFMSKDITEFRDTIEAMFMYTHREENFTWQYYLTNRALLFLIISVLGQVFGLKKIKNIINSYFSTNVGIIVKRISLILLFVVDILYVVNSTYSPFIYFQF